jgi:hypothetical protein
MPIQRQPRPQPEEDLFEPAAPEPDEGPVDLVDVRDLDVNIGPGETLSFTLTADDTLDIRPDVFLLVLAGNSEQIEILRPVRWWSLRTRKLPVPRSLDPADAPR